MGVIIGFGHRSGVGKDTSAKFLDTVLRMRVPQIRIKKVSFASKLKDITYDLFQWTGIKRPIHYENKREDRDLIIPELNRTIVDLWVDVGEKFREVYDKVWIDFVIKSKMEYDVLLVSDVRHIVEVEAIQESGGEIYKIINSRIPHRTGKSIDDFLEDFKGWTGILENEGSMDDLYSTMANLAETLIERYSLDKN